MIGCAICFESVFPGSVSECVKEGAEAIIILTNDSWLGNIIPLYQHHSHSVMRAVENNRYVLTSTNTGISSVINNKGEVIVQSELNTESVIESSFYMNNDISFYTKYGDVVIFPSCMIIIFVCLKFVFRQIYGLIFKKT
jgi:apolipoprotein N-acyltransferase